MTRIFIGVGRDVNIRPGDLVGAIANEANVPAKFIGAIDISERFSLVEVDSAQADKIVNTMQRVRFKGRPATVKFDGTREERSDRFDRDSRHQQDRQYRGARSQREFYREPRPDNRRPRR